MRRTHEKLTTGRPCCRARHSVSLASSTSTPDVPVTTMVRLSSRVPSSTTTPPWDSTSAVCWCRSSTSPSSRWNCRPYSDCDMRSSDDGRDSARGSDDADVDGDTIGGRTSAGDATDVYSAALADAGASAMPPPLSLLR